VLSEDEALSIAYQVAQALQHAHWSGLVHRDVKPENIMVTPDGTAKLLDLGLARSANDEATRLTQTGMFVGSAYYASPEQAKSESDIDTRSDIYSLGATLYHMVTGNPPFQGSNAAYILYQQAYEKLTWPAEVNPELSDGDIDKLREGGEVDVTDAALKNSSVALALRGRDDELRLAPPPSELRPVRKRRRLPSSPRLKRQRPASSAGLAPAEATGKDGAEGKHGSGRPTISPAAAKWVMVVGIGVIWAIILGIGFFMLGGKKQRGAPLPSDSEAAPTQPLAPGDAHAVGGKTSREPNTRLRSTRRHPEEPSGPSTPPARCAPSIVSAATRVAISGQAFSHEFRAFGNPEPALRILHPLPPWLEFDGKDTVTGTPPDAAVGTRTELTIKASNGEGEHIQRFTIICGSAGAPASRAPAPADGRPPATTAKPPETALTETGTEAREKPEETIDRVLAEFDALVSDGDFSGARRAMETEARKPENAPVAHALRAAARVAALLDGRKKTIRRKAQSLVDAGAEMTLVTRKGELKGRIVNSNTWGLELIVTTQLAGGGNATRPAEVGWSELTPAQMEAFTGDWPPEGADGHVARGMILLLEGKKTAAKKAFAAAGVSPVAAYFLAREARAAAEDAAEAAWELIKRAAAKERTPDAATSLSTRIAAFEKEHGDTGFARSVAGELARIIKSMTSLKLTGGRFGFRGRGTRLPAALRAGGSEESEAAVDAALRWLASNQEPDGSWDIEKWGGTQTWGKVGVTGLATLAFLGAGHTEDAGAHKASVIKAISYLIGQQNGQGAIGSTSGGHWGYCHAIAGLALAEAYGMARVARTGEAAQKAVDWSIEGHQKEYSGWRYYPKSSPDTSVTGWFIMQLKSAKIAELKVDGKGFQGAIAWLDKVTNMPAQGWEECGRAGYTSKSATHTMTAIAMLGRQVMGWKQTDPLLVGGADYLVKSLPQWGQGGWSMYRWYYGTLAMFQMGGDWWKQWNANLRDMLIKNQIKSPDPKMDGSWDPSFSSGGKRAGRAYSTAMACLCLEIYYRYRPLLR